jgi:gag-polypeptide of LTR copia-type
MAKVLDFKLQLQTAKKGASTCSQYLQQMQSLADRLLSVGTTVTDQELILYILQGLGSDFESFVTAFTMRSIPPSMLEFSNLLLAHESRIQANLRSTTTSAVNLTTHASGQPSGQTQSSTDNSVFYANSSNPGQGGYKGKNNNYRGRGNQRGRGRGRHNNSSNVQDQLQCQICARHGHGALDCYHRFDIRYTGPPTAFSTQDSVVPQPQPQNPQHQALIAQPTTSAPSSSSSQPPP